MCLKKKKKVAPKKEVIRETFACILCLISATQVGKEAQSSER